MIVVDWGTTHLRAYRLAASGEIQARKSVAKGIMSIAPGTFAAVLEDVLGDWRGARIKSTTCDATARERSIDDLPRLSFNWSR